MALRLGIDTGGTFTDVALFDTGSGELKVLKTPSTPSDPGNAVLTGAESALERYATAGETVEYFAHGTTVATNTLLEGKGAKIAIFVTEGFRDLLELGRQRRPKLYDLYAQKPELLTGRDLIFEVGERLKYDGTVMQELDEAAVAQLVEDNRAALDEVDALAVCFLYSFENSAHERAVGEILARALPGKFVTLSSDVLPQFREFERLSTTSVNAYIGPIMQGYLGSLRRRLGERGLSDAPKVTQSNGGVISFQTAEQMPVRTVLSGPSTGVVGAAEVARNSGFEHVITLDVGGTSSDIALVNDGTPTSSNGMELDGRPIQAPMLDISTVGAGGGSIAWIDDGGLLKVGPESAGAYPGPACYGNGNMRPTVTDANVVLGILNNDALLAGAMPIDASLSFAAVKSLGDQLGLSTEETAQGIISVVTANMAKAIRVISVQKGYDPSDYALVAFGGAGPLHSGRLARELRMSTTLVPQSPGAMSAIGMLMTDLKSDFIATARTPLDEAAGEKTLRVFETLATEAATWQTAEALPDERVVLKHFADVRYRGQNYEITVGVDHLEDTARLLADLQADFEARHRELYGYINADSVIEIVNFRIQAVGTVDTIEVTQRPAARAAGEPMTRQVYISEYGERAEVPVLERTSIPTGESIAGPVVIEQYDTTSFVLPGQTAHIDPSDMLIIADD
ncbi:hydantoinase/oxoprolinase family protein [Brevibacterium sp. 50QC2O2]|jgi:N-methylhydantoinase A|uniref:hydantoinase/oxoprolinase family protein n=1 Tax=unclassified Brevibacterium TaxID=2614124 RepID=UPI00211C6749|nr:MULTISPECIES: hydantoinase/oxoprolinase family protein [unclassified Brevibacterium]MCQ9369439.1 hydantoinase/oxoprolinase family protein [Brevibacterium sp. 91QC2O2]MCQ9388504.1 hydantoinase/oxoprolinase family protein [Brevibacterium sp. 50QC2O2]